MAYEKTLWVFKRSRKGTTPPKEAKRRVRLEKESKGGGRGKSQTEKREKNK